MIVRGNEVDSTARLEVDRGLRLHQMIGSLRSKAVDTYRGSAEFSRLAANGIANLDTTLKCCIAVGLGSFVFMGAITGVRSALEFMTMPTNQELAAAAQGDTEYILEQICRKDWGSSDINTTGQDTIFVRIRDEKFNGPPRTLTLQKQRPEIKVDELITVRDFRGSKDVEVGQAEPPSARFKTADINLYEGPILVAQYPEMSLVCAPQ